MPETTVTIEGSRLRPSTVLRAGERRTVILTDRVQRLIDKGFVVEIDRTEPAPPPPKTKPGEPVDSAFENADDLQTQVSEPESLVPPEIDPHGLPTADG